MDRESSGNSRRNRHLSRFAGNNSVHPDWRLQDDEGWLSGNADNFRQDARHPKRQVQGCGKTRRKTWTWRARQTKGRQASCRWIKRRTGDAQGAQVTRPEDSQDASACADQRTQDTQDSSACCDQGQDGSHGRLLQGQDGRNG